jgi:hypothetical protein
VQERPRIRVGLLVVFAVILGLLAIAVGAGGYVA